MQGVDVLIDLTETAENNENSAIKNMINNAFYDEYYVQIRTIAARILQSYNQTDEIDDCVNTIFLELMTKFKDYDKTRGDIGAFVTVVARSTALNYRKKAMKKSNELIGDEKLDFLAMPIDYKEEVDFNLLVESIVDKLNNQDRLLFSMRYLYHYSPEEIAKTLKIKRSAVDMRIMRLKAKIKKNLIKGGISI